MGRRVTVTIEEVELAGDYSDAVPGVIVTCSECGASVEVYGTGENSVRRGCVMLREQCDGANFYTHD
jgi:hypothetical protein